MGFDFKPSARLLSFWTDGIASMSPPLVRLALRLKLKVPPPEKVLISHFNETLFGAIIAQFRFRRSDEIDLMLPFSGSDGLYQDMKAFVVGSFPIKSVHVDEFSDQIEAELTAHFETHEPLTAQWGRLGMREGVLMVELTRREPVTIERRTSRVIEVEL